MCKITESETTPVWEPLIARKYFSTVSLALWKCTSETFLRGLRVIRNGSDFLLLKKAVGFILVYLIKCTGVKKSVSCGQRMVTSQLRSKSTPVGSTRNYNQWGAMFPAQWTLLPLAMIVLSDRLTFVHLLISPHLYRCLSLTHLFSINPVLLNSTLALRILCLRLAVRTFLIATNSLLHISVPPVA